MPLFQRHLVWLGNLSLFADNNDHLRSSEMRGKRFWIPFVKIFCDQTIHLNIQTEKAVLAGLWKYLLRRQSVFGILRFLFSLGSANHVIQTCLQGEEPDRSIKKEEVGEGENQFAFLHCATISIEVALVIVRRNKYGTKHRTIAG